MHYSTKFFIIIIFQKLIKLAAPQSAELDELQKLCPSLRGIYCSHCGHKSVEEICPIECRFCVGGGGSNALSASSLRSFGAGNGFQQQIQGASNGGIGTFGGINPAAAAVANPRTLSSLLPQNLGVLKRQCTIVRGLYCTMCKVSSISELCVDECLACENGPLNNLGGKGGGGGFGTIGSIDGNIGIGTGGGGAGDNDNWLTELSNELVGQIDGTEGNGVGEALNGGAKDSSTNLMEIFRQLQKIEQEERESSKNIDQQQEIVDDDLGGEIVEDDTDDDGILFEGTNARGVNERDGTGIFTAF